MRRFRKGKCSDLVVGLGEEAPHCTIIMECNWRLVQTSRLIPGW